MVQWKKNLIVLWLAAFSSAMSFSLVTPFMPLFLRELNVVKGIEAWSGLAVSVSFLMNAIMSPVWGSLADRYGRKVMVLRSGFAQAIVYCLQYFVTNPYQFVALRILNGTFSGMNPACNALVATNTPEDQVSYSLGIMQTAAASGGMLGPLIGGVSATFLGYRMTFMGAGVVLLSSTLLAMFIVRESAPKNAESKVEIVNDLKTAMANPMLRTVFITALIVQASLSVLQPVLSLQVLKLGGEGAGPMASGIIFSLAGIATVLASPLWASYGKAHGFRGVLIWGLFAAGLVNFPMAVVRSLVVFGALRFAMGLATAGGNLSISSLTAKSVDPTFRGRAFGILASCNQMGSFLGPMMGGLSGTALGLTSTFYVSAGTLLLGSAFVFKALPHEPAAGQAKAT